MARSQVLPLLVLAATCLAAWRVTSPLFVSSAAPVTRSLRGHTALRAEKEDALIASREGRAGMLKAETGAFEYSTGARNEESLITPQVDSESIRAWLSLNINFFFILVFFTAGGLIELQRFFPDAMMCAARVLKKVIGFNPYLNIVVGMGITIMVQSSSITTSTLTPIAAVGLISLDEMFPLTLGANIGTTLTGIMGATVATSNPVEAMQVALCHLFFNLFGILLFYPVPQMRNIPLSMCRFLGHMTAHPKYGKVFPLIYTGIVFFAIPGISYGIASAATA